MTFSKKKGVKPSKFFWMHAEKFVEFFRVGIVRVKSQCKRKKGGGGETRRSTEEEEEEEEEEGSTLYRDSRVATRSAKREKDRSFRTAFALTLGTKIENGHP
jgi:hypothetical protein